MGKLFYIIGKSATGKDHIYTALLSDASLALRPLVLYTTRPMRRNEKEGREYHFTDEDTFLRLSEEGKIIEARTYQTVCGPWHYFTADDGQLDLFSSSYLGIGTLDSFSKLRSHFDRKYGTGSVCPLYIETCDGLRIERALRREKKQPSPNYPEMCRRFLADTEDFSDDRILAAGIGRRFINETTLQECIDEVRDYILAHQE